MMTSLTDQIDSVLPQTQCRRCGFNDCRAYAEAVAASDTGINRCPPGGAGTIETLAALTGQPVVPLDATLDDCSTGGAAVIDELFCIGCTKCIEACPVDAIVGAPKFMHTVIEALCTGCGLCVPPCPVDCIHLQAPSGSTGGIVQPEAGRARADFFRNRYRQRNMRLERLRHTRESHREAMQAGKAAEAIARRKAEIAAAVARVRARRAQRQSERNQ